MVVSDPAFMYLQEPRESLLRRFANFLGFSRQIEALPFTERLPETTFEAVIVSEPIAEPMPLAAAIVSVEQTIGVEKVVNTTARVIALTAIECRARAIALRGLAQARGQKYEAAHASFLEAMSMDATIDLAKLPDFWKLPQEAHQAAIEAYERIGRRRDAAQLTALVRETFRPKIIKTKPVVVAPLLREA